MSNAAALRAAACLCSALACWLSGLVRAAEISRKIDQTAAAILAANATGVKRRDVDYTARGFDPPFFGYAVVVSPSDDRAYGFVDVNPWTGDVWALFGCKRLSTSALRTAQENIKRRFDDDEMRQYERLRNLKPGCFFESAEMPRKIDNITAMALAAKATGWRPNDFEDGGPRVSPPFFVYMALSGPPAEGGAAGYFAVNPWTGDVWDLWGCKRLSTPALDKALEKIRQRDTGEQKKYHDPLHDLKAECISGDDDP